MSDDELGAALPPETDPSGSWAATGTIFIGEDKVFLKRVPLTDTEVERPYSTRNHFGLPTYYSYGVGSAGFGAWRELAGLEAMSGTAGFPVLIGHRIMARTAPERDRPWGEDEYMAYWRNSAAVGRYVQARREAAHELWMFLEHVPHPLVMWLLANQERTDEVLSQLFAAIAELGARGIVHFDAHLGNVVTDGAACRLADFGLAMAEGFELGARERAFLAAHRHYDYGVVVGFLGIMLAVALGGELSEAQLPSAIDQVDELPINHLPALREAIRRHREPILYMLDVFLQIRRPAKRSTYDDMVLADLLRQSGVPGL